MASDISLTAGMRNNLLSLQNTVSLLDRTQERLATGKKVNSALDDPGAYFKAKALNDRSNDIGLLKDNMGQALQTVQAADKGIKAITSLVQQAKAIAEQAKMAAAAASPDTAVLDSYSVQLYTLFIQIDYIAETSGYQGVNLIDGSQTAGFEVQFEGTGRNLSIVGVDFTSSGFAATLTAPATMDTAGIDQLIEDLSAALTEMRTGAEALSTNMAIIQTQISFTTDMQNVLTIGADKLTLADTNEEGANMLMLQTRQSLSTTALSLSAQAAQSVLRLFG
jgi:flagellin-like hook-associated protein FlgL